MLNKAIIYLSSNVIETNKTRITSIGIHGYIYDEEEVKRIGRTPDNYKITNIGYIEGTPTTDNVTIVYPHTYLDVTSNVHDVKNKTIAIYVDMLKYLIEKHNVTAITVYTKDNYLSYVTDNIILVKDENDDNRELNTIMVNTPIAFHHLQEGYTNIALTLSNALLSIATKITNVKLDVKESESKKYWSIPIQPHTFLNFKQIFFNNDKREMFTIDANGVQHPIRYVVMDYKKAEPVGSKSNVALFGIVMLNKKEDMEFIEQAIDKYYRLNKVEISISALELKNLYSWINIHYYNLYGELVYGTNKRKSMVTVDGTEIVRPIVPSGLATQTYDRILSLNRIIDDYTNKGNIFNYIDITSHIYKDNSCFLPVGTNEIILDIPTTAIIPTLANEKIKRKIYLTLGSDTITRNHFKRIEKDKPKVILAIDNITDTVARYHTIIETDSGEMSIWCNFYTNLIIARDMKKE